MSLLVVFLGLHRTMRLPMGGHHAWRQADCLSLTAGYQEAGSTFHEGHMHYLGNDGSGASMSDFPLLYWGVGHLWRTTGRSELSYRLLVFVIFLIGQLSLFLAVRRVLQDGVLAAWIAAFLITSPMVAYYANNFLMNMPALSLVLVGWYALVRAVQGQSRGWWVAMLGSFVLAGLMKPTAALSLLGGLGVAFLAGTRWRNTLLGDPPVRPRPVRLLLVAIGCVLPMMAWYLYADHYNVSHASGVFLTGISPAWELDRQAIGRVFEGIRVHLRNDYFRPALYPLFALALVAVAGLHRELPRWSLVLLGTLIAGALTIMLLFFPAWEDHDYYSLDQVFLAPLLLTMAALAVRRRWPGMLGRAWVQLVLLALLVHSADHTRRRLIDRHEGWRSRPYDVQFAALMEIGPWLDEHGVSDRARVILLPDRSFNIGLYRMDRKGWSDFGGLSQDPAKLAHCLDLGATHLVVCNDTLLRSPVLAPYLDHPVGTYRNVHVFELGGPDR